MAERSAHKKKDGGLKSSGLQATDKKGCLWIVIPDSINMDNYQQVESGMEAILADRPARVVIDLCKTKNMYSAGFGLIVRLKKRVGDHGGHLYLVNASPRVVEGLAAVGLNKLMPVYPEHAELGFLS